MSGSRKLVGRLLSRTGTSEVWPGFLVVVVIASAMTNEKRSAKSFPFRVSSHEACDGRLCRGRSAYGRPSGP